MISVLSNDEHAFKLKNLCTFSTVLTGSAQNSHHCHHFDLVACTHGLANFVKQ